MKPDSHRLATFIERLVPIDVAPISASAEIPFLKAQLQVLQDAGPHYTRDLGVAVARIHKRLDELEA